MNTVRHAVAAIGALLAALGRTAYAAEPAVEVFTTSALPVTNVRDATVYHLDAIALLEQQLSLNLPPDPALAQQRVRQRLAALGPELTSRTRGAATGLARAAQLGLQRAPAVVFDGRWAVYGFTDVDAARRVFARSVPPERR